MGRIGTFVSCKKSNINRFISNAVIFIDSFLRLRGVNPLRSPAVHPYEYLEVLVGSHRDERAVYL